MIDLRIPTPNGAILSPCGRYRYLLKRHWEEGCRALVFLMLNPSTADAEIDDPTIRRCVGFARREGYGGIRVVNLFAYRATDPATLARVHDPVGPENDDILKSVFARISPAYLDKLPCVAAWGAKPVATERALVVRGMARAFGVDLRCFGKTAGGAPRHPLYLPRDAKLEIFA